MFSGYISESSVFELKMNDLLIDKKEHRERVLRACQDYNKLRRDTLGLSHGNCAHEVTSEVVPALSDSVSEAEPVLFDGIPDGSLFNEHQS